MSAPSRRTIDTEYLLDTSRDAALPGLAGLYDPAHNPLFRLPLSGDGAIALFGFFRRACRRPASWCTTSPIRRGTPASSATCTRTCRRRRARRYALLQTPEFVEEFDPRPHTGPGDREFGLREVRMIDPACGSGHFLLGGFDRLLRRGGGTRRDMPPAAQAQRRWMRCPAWTSIRSRWRSRGSGCCWRRCRRRA